MRNGYKIISETTILMYHEVTNSPERLKTIREISPSDSLVAEHFEEQMALISEMQTARVISTKEIISESEEKFGRIVITFDDGLAGNYVYAFKILENFGFKATFFVTVNDISKNRYMNWEQLRILSKNNHSIQSHTMTHPMLGECDGNQIIYELETSKKVIENKIGEQVKYLSLPFGSWNDNVIKIAKQAGYEAIFTSSFRSKNINNQLYLFGRIPIRDTYSIRKFAKLIQRDSWLLMKIRMGNDLKSMVKRGIGLNNYRKIFRWIYRIEL